MKNINLQKYWMILFIIALIGCANEDPNLVNPKLPNQTIRVRFFNLADDNQSRVLVLSSNTKTQSTTAGALSLPLMPPPLDSVYVSTEINGSTEYKLPNRLRMIRDTKYVIFGLPKPNSLKPLDTLLVTTTTYTPLRDKNDCFISMVNVDKDTNSSYSIVMGCPNGTSIFPFLRYLQSSIDFETISTDMPVSIVKLNQNVRTSIGLFNLKLFKGGEFQIVINGDTPDKIFILNKQDTTAYALQPLQQITNQQSFVRTINFSKSDISISKEPSDPIVTNQAPETISDYVPVKACDSETLDSIVISSGGIYSKSLTTSFVVNSQYTMLILDSTNSTANLCLLVPPQVVTSPLGDSAMIRVINAIPDIGNVTLSMGARDSKILNSNDTLNPGFVSGEFLAAKISYGKISNPVFLPSGRAPMTLFTESQPNKLLHTALSDLLPGGKYLAVISSDDKGDPQITMIEDNEVSKNLSPCSKGSFLQIANILPGSYSTDISIPGVLTKAKLYYTNTISTVVPLGMNTIHAGNASLDYNAIFSKREIAVVAGTALVPEILDYQSDIPSYDIMTFSRRLFNAAKDQPSIDVTNFSRETDPDLAPLAAGVAYGEVTNYISSNIERKNAYFFYPVNTKELLLQINDISMILGKSYTVIFGGDKTITKTDPLTYRYSIILLQDY